MTDNMNVALKLLKVNTKLTIYSIIIDIWHGWLKIKRKMYKRGETARKIITWFHNLIYRKFYWEKWNVHSSRMGWKRWSQIINKISTIKTIIFRRKKSVELFMVNSKCIKTYVIFKNYA